MTTNSSTVTAGEARLGEAPNISQSVTAIEPARTWALPQLGALWKYRELTYFLVWRDVKARYKQTAFGAAWAIFQPLLATIVFTIVFGYIVRVPSEGIPYPLFSMAGLVPWMYFSRSLERISNSVIESTNMVTKVYFPRLVLPFGGLFSGLIDLGAALLVLLGMLAFYEGISLTLTIFLLPIFIFLAMITALGVGLWLSALNVYYRDVKYVVPFITQVWMYATPIIYPVSMVPEQFRLIYGLNPMVGVISGFRWALLGEGSAPDWTVLLSSAISILILFTGLVFFQRMEEKFADVI